MTPFGIENEIQIPHQFYRELLKKYSHFELGKHNGAHLIQVSQRNCLQNWKLLQDKRECPEKNISPYVTILTAASYRGRSRSVKGIYSHFIILNSRVLVFNWI